MKTNFDYIVIGAGSAGSVLAARLTEDADVTVALIEAGDSDNALEIDVPLLFPHLFKTQFDWDFASEPEPALKQRRIYLPRGKVLGGSSSINAMVYIQLERLGHDGDAARAEPLDGCVDAGHVQAEMVVTGPVQAVAEVGIGADILRGGITAA